MLYSCVDSVPFQGSLWSCAPGTSMVVDHSSSLCVYRGSRITFLTGHFGLSGALAVPPMAALMLMAFFMVSQSWCGFSGAMLRSLCCLPSWLGSAQGPEVWVQLRTQGSSSFATFWSPRLTGTGAGSGWPRRGHPSTPLGFGCFAASCHVLKPAPGEDPAPQPLVAPKAAADIVRESGENKEKHFCGE